MKKLLFIIICIIALTFCGTGGRAEASAETESYAQAANSTAYFFSQKDLSTSLFAVPYTYCVRIVRDDGQWYYVQYAEDEGIYRALYGYVLKSDFYLLTEPPPDIYLIKSVTITYSAGDDSASLPALGEIEVEAAFYGTYYSGATAYSYVLCNGSFGYIAGANDDYPLNPLPTDETEETVDESGGDASVVTAVVIVALASGAIILVFLSTKKRKSD